MLNADDIASALRSEGDDEVSARTVHFYRQQGILPPAYGRGDTAFGPEHLALMREARRLRRAGESLERIRDRLAARRTSTEAKRGRALAASAPSPSPAVAADALRARSGRLPRSLRLRGGFVLQCPPDAGDDLVARLYTAIDSILAAETAGTTTTKKRGRNDRPQH